MKHTPMHCMYLLGGTLDPWSDELKVGGLSGLQLKACSVALKQFSKSYPTAQLENFIVLAKDEPNGFEVTFLPNFEDLPEHGSKTSFGEEVHYFVSLDKFEIVRTYFGR